MTDNLENGSLNSNAPMPQTPIPAPPAGLPFPAQSPVVSAPPFASQSHHLTHGQPQYAPTSFDNNSQKKSKNRKLIITVAIALIVVLLAGIVFGALMLFGFFRTAPKSGLSTSAPVPVTVVDVTDMPKDLKIVPVNSDNLVLQTPGYDILRFADDKQGVLLGMPVSDDQKPWMSEISAFAYVVELGDAVLYGGKDPNAQFQTIDVKTGSKRFDGVTVPRDELPQPRDPKRVYDCVDAKGTGNAIASISGDKITVCSDGRAVWGVSDKKVTWTVPDLGDLKSINGFGAVNQKWMLDGDMLVLATPQAVQAIDVRDGKNLWSVEKPVRSWSVSGNSLYIQEDGARQLTKYDLSKNPKPAKDNQTPIKPEDSKKAEAAELFKKIQGKRLAGDFSRQMMDMVFGADGQVSGKYVKVLPIYNTYERQQYEGRFEYLGMKNATTARLKMTGLKMLETPKTINHPDGGYERVPNSIETLVDGDEYELYLPGTKDTDTILGYIAHDYSYGYGKFKESKLDSERYGLMWSKISKGTEYWALYNFKSNGQ